MKRLIVIRGNSASGKTSTAKLLQKKLGRSTMLLSHDTLRREVLYAHENAMHPTPQLLQLMANFGWDNSYDTVIIEGIWGTNKNGEILHRLVTFADEAYVYYFDIPFEETLKRHDMKPGMLEYGETELRDWWHEKDVLGIDDEVIIGSDVSLQQVVESILLDIGKGQSSP